MPEIVLLLCDVEMWSAMFAFLKSFKGNDGVGLMDVSTVVLSLRETD